MINKMGSSRDIGDTVRINMAEGSVVSRVKQRPGQPDPQLLNLSGEERA